MEEGGWGVKEEKGKEHVIQRVSFKFQQWRSNTEIQHLIPALPRQSNRGIQGQAHHRSLGSPCLASPAERHQSKNGVEEGWGCIIKWSQFIQWEFGAVMVFGWGT